MNDLLVTAALAGIFMFGIVLLAVGVSAMLDGCDE